MSTPTPTSKGKKRRRTRSTGSSASPHGFKVTGFDASSSSPSSSKTTSLNELLDTSRGLTNMVLAHEIAVNRDFKLEDLKPESSALEKNVKDMLHKVFWDQLREELSRSPPAFQGALSVFGEAKGIILKLLTLPQHSRLQTEIMEKLDLELIEQQAANGVLDVENYAQYVLSLLARLCAPIRDEKIAELKGIQNIVSLLQGIMETLDLMNLDMANFTLHKAKPFIIAKSVEYEKDKFREFLSKQEDGLRTTREWLLRHASNGLASKPEEETPSYRKLLVNRVLIDAYSELLQWDEYYDLPETLVMDYKRIAALRDRVERTSVSTAVILCAFSGASEYIVPADAQGLKLRMKKDVDILLEDFYLDDDLLEILPKLGDQVIKIINEYLQKDKRGPPSLLPEGVGKAIRDNLAQMEDPNHRIRDLVQGRILDFAKRAAVGSKSGAPLQIPPGLTLCSKELGMIAGGFVQLISYNRSVFGDTYVDLIENHVLFREDASKDGRESRTVEA
eukprot:TRINITY_DN1204_c2_g3_i1.p1 TRINITY_DN1204_c2_g3~~TRINITY_DN1204_c2_g3_i1.p1  ORF type:complete len:505 (-),score=132.02 TRINITY_DN1204_c2_g3_i1:1035-2549(-)